MPLDWQDVTNQILDVMTVFGPADTFRARLLRLLEYTVEKAFIS